MVHGLRDPVPLGAGREPRGEAAASSKERFSLLFRDDLPRSHYEISPTVLLDQIQGVSWGTNKNSLDISREFLFTHALFIFLPPDQKTLLDAHQTPQQVLAYEMPRVKEERAPLFEVILSEMFLGQDAES